MSKNTTIKDVAKLAGVSLSTVSRVLNNNVKVAPELKEKVLSAIKELNYNPNQAARFLAKKKPDTIGIIVTNLHSPFYSELVHGFEDGAEELGFNIIFCSALKSGESSNRDKYVKFLTNGFVDGVILYGSYLSDESIINYLKDQKNVEYLIIENDFKDTQCNKILINNLEGSSSAVNYLFKNGHTKIAYLAGNPNRKISIDRYNGYINAMQTNGLDVKDGYIQFSFKEKDCIDNIRNLMKLDDPPTAIYCFNDIYASLAIKQLNTMGYRVPEDISIIGFDNSIISTADYKGPDITTIAQPLYTIGKESVEILAKKLLETDNPKYIHKIYNTKLIEKDTVININ